MSKIAKNSIKFSKEIDCSFENGILIAKGKLGELSLTLNSLYTLDIREEELFVIPKNSIKLFVKRVNQIKYKIH